MAATDADTRTDTYTSSRQVRCTTCRVSGWITYDVEVRTWVSHMGMTRTSTLSHSGTGRVKTLDRKGDDDRFVLGVARELRGCGHPLKTVVVKGFKDERRPCGDRCMGAVGPSCDCSCGGENHGKSHGFW